MIGHNQISVDSAVEENLLKGVYLAQLQCITRAVRDPRLIARHLQVLAHIIERTNIKTGMAYPGRARLAADITYYVNGEARHYSEATIATTISELIECGYIIADKRAPEGKGRALAHYVTIVPSMEDLQNEIDRWCQIMKGRPRRDFPAPRPFPDVDTGINVSHDKKVPKNRPDVDAAVNVSSSDVDTGIDVNAGVNVDAGIGADVDTGIGQELVDNKLVPPAPKRKTRTKLPEHWKPAEQTIAWAKENFVVSDPQVADEAEKFHDYHYSRGNAMADWPAAWRQWWRNGFHKFKRRRKPTVGEGTAALPFSNASLSERHEAEEYAAALERIRAEEDAERCRR
jgi:hypothetical protein